MKDYLSAEEMNEIGSSGTLPFVFLRGVCHFDIAKTFDCGQCFRFFPVTGGKHDCEYAGVAHGKFISVAGDGQDVYIYNSTLDDFYSIWEKYLGFDQDYSDYENRIIGLSDNPSLREAVEDGDGIRILRQEPWETICSFILSQNNNIPRIRKLVAALAEARGELIDTSLMKLHGGDGVFYSFPSPSCVMSLGIDGLAGLRTGFRAGYLYDASSRVCDGRLSLDALAGDIPTSDVIKLLCEVRGIGPKVGSCIALYSYARYDAFPIDVWIKRVLARCFPADFDPASLGELAGIAQQFLFYHERKVGGVS